MTVQAGLQAMKLQELKTKKPNRASGLRRRARDRERLVHAQAGHDVRDPQGARRAQCRDHRRRRARNPAGRLRLPALAGIELPRRARTTSTSRPRRSAASACAPATRSKARSAAPRTASAISRCSRSSTINFEDPEPVKHKVHFDNLTPLYPTERLQHGARRSDHQGQDRPRHRHRRAARQGPARADHRAAAHRQDRHPAEHRQGDRGQPSRIAT